LETHCNKNKHNIVSCFRYNINRGDLIIITTINTEIYSSDTVIIPAQLLTLGPLLHHILEHYYFMYCITIR